MQYRKGVELGFHFKCLSNQSNVQALCLVWVVWKQSSMLDYPDR